MKSVRFYYKINFNCQFLFRYNLFLKCFNATTAYYIIDIINNSFVKYDHIIVWHLPINSFSGLSLAVSLDKWIVCISPGCPGGDGDGQTVRILSSKVERLPLAASLASHSFWTLRFAWTICENSHQSSGKSFSNQLSRLTKKQSC